MNHINIYKIYNYLHKNNTEKRWVGGISNKLASPCCKFLTVGSDDDDFSVIVTVCRGPCALGIYSTHDTPSFMHHYGFKKGIRAVSCPYPTPILH